MKNKPIIGIVTKHYLNGLGEKDLGVSRKIKQAVFDNDGVAIGILTPEKDINYSGDKWKDNLSEETRENLIRQIKLCDGIILQGGLETDNYEIIIAKYCYDNDIPILGICAGQNNIARALGGSTYQIPNYDKHCIETGDYVHKITINKDSKFFEIVNQDEIMVNSIHKRTIKDCPKLEKSSFCEDGYPDVIESKDKRFHIGIRFHPEYLYEKDENHRKIFKSFIKACEK